MFKSKTRNSRILVTLLSGERSDLAIINLVQIMKSNMKWACRPTMVISKTNDVL